MAAVTQVRHDTPGRAYYLRKQAEGKSRKEALRALKRRISDAVYQRLAADARPLNRSPRALRRRKHSQVPREDNAKTSLNPAWPASHLT